jgi:hypothetical protein
MRPSLSISLHSNRWMKALPPRGSFHCAVDDLVDTLKVERIHHSTKDYAEGLVIGDDIKADVEGNDVYLLKPDGKTLKTSVMKRERTTK